MIIRTSRTGSPSGISWMARVQARSRREIHRYASAVMYARRGGAAATSGSVGGGVPVALSDLSDWRSWPAERDAELDELEGRALRLLQAALVKKETETVDILVPFVAALNHRSVSSVPRG